MKNNFKEFVEENFKMSFKDFIESCFDEKQIYDKETGKFKFKKEQKI